MLAVKDARKKQYYLYANKPVTWYVLVANN